MNNMGDDLSPVTRPPYNRRGSRRAAGGERGSPFVLDSGFAAAGETLADRREFLLDNQQWAAFLSVLDAPPRAKPRLEKVLKTPSVFE